ncbi:hypothetical protein CEUSTIGMA_g7493.t1 [Chlamydomonas eustigma]|uniref:Uncharacterized protein n=1 Tax=Chlamydomonas eustigma TaxID=1157962 RepID=A0A250XAG8_9CHLO|nr:hypothetical protein CEUSTIGMA_g7493.t1 [Chlamydomonas eustigma]|eukprot:GAX80054.1 hypothetical protein CEUSTIGMA_g7493.t1 [Chlamydomonas eustigma]
MLQFLKKYNHSRVSVLIKYKTFREETPRTARNKNSPSHKRQPLFPVSNFPTPKLCTDSEGARQPPMRPPSGPIMRFQSSPPDSILRVGEHTSIKAAAGSIAKGMALQNKVLLLAKGANAVYIAICAVATARVMSRHGEASGHDIIIQPALDRNPQNGAEKHGIRLYLYKTDFLTATDSRAHQTAAPDDSNIVSYQERNTGALPDVGESAELEQERTVRVMQLTRPEKLAGSIATILQSGIESGRSGGSSCSLKAAGSISVYRAVRGLAIARHVMLRKNTPSSPTQLRPYAKEDQQEARSDRRTAHFFAPRV